MGTKVVAIVGSYRRGGTVDTAVQAILEGAREKGAETKTIYLTDQYLDFCMNCRRCTQEPGVDRGICDRRDDLESILMEVDSADALVLGSAVNFWNVTAIYRQFMERLVGNVYWPWGNAAPKPRNKHPTKKAALVASSAAPGFLIPLCTGAAKALRVSAQMLGAKPVGRLWIGLAGQKPNQPLSSRTLAHARRIGLKLAKPAAATLNLADGDAKSVSDDAFNCADEGHLQPAGPPGANGDERFGCADCEVRSE
jgi:NAD(P)H-dependent FMN reductase